MSLFLKHLPGWSTALQGSTTHNRFLKKMEKLNKNYFPNYLYYYLLEVLSRSICWTEENGLKTTSSFSMLQKIRTPRIVKIMSSTLELSSTTIRTLSRLTIFNLNKSRHFIFILKLKFWPGKLWDLPPPTSLWPGQHMIKRFHN